MDKLSEHAIRMLEIANREGVCNSDVDAIAQAVYDLILQVQILKMADRKESGIPTSSEKPNNCETCRHWWKSEDVCMLDDCHYEPKDEPHHSGEVTEMVEPQTERSE